MCTRRLGCPCRSIGHCHPVLMPGNRGPCLRLTVITHTQSGELSHFGKQNPNSHLQTMKQDTSRGQTRRSQFPQEPKQVSHPPSEATGAFGKHDTESEEPTVGWSPSLNAAGWESGCCSTTQAGPSQFPSSKMGMPHLRLP